MPQAKYFLVVFLFLSAAFPVAYAQLPIQTEKKVENPIGAAEAQRKAQRQEPAQPAKITAQLSPTPTEDVTITADKGDVQDKVTIYTGNVEIHYHGRYGDIAIYADRITYNGLTSDALAEGDVYFEQNGEKFVGERMEFNLKTERGSIYNPTGFTSSTRDGTVLTIDAARADKTGEDTYNLSDAILTACGDRVPKWAFTAKRARIRVDHRAKVYNAFFRVKGVPILWVPYASLPISKRDRSSGFLLPSTGSSNLKGRTAHVAYYQTLGRSADILFRTDVYSKRGIGLGFDFRARTNETSRVYFGSFTVLDRLFGQKGEDASGTSFYADAVHNFKNGFVAVADVNITSSYTFRNVFADNVLTAISPEERSIFYLNKNWRSYSFNASFGEQSFFIGRFLSSDGKYIRNPDGGLVGDDQIVKMRQFPAIELNKRSTKLSETLPFYFSFESSLGGVRRSETRGEQALLKTPSIVQRLDFFPRFTFPLKPVAGFTFTPSVALRSTFYSDSLDPVQRQVVGSNLFRNYAEVSVDIRPPALAKVYRNKDHSPWFKHVIEPYAEYRRIVGIDDFARTIRSDERDVVAETNEIEYGVINRFFVKRLSADGKSSQAHEWLDLTIAQKYFFDPTFGGAFKGCTQAEFLSANCTRNQFLPLMTLTGFNYAGLKRNSSPLNVRARMRPTDTLFADVKLNYDTEFHHLRDVVFGGGMAKGIFQVSNSWYYTRRIAVDKFREELPFDPSSLPGNQFDFSAFVGNPGRGPYGGFTIIYDLRNKYFDGTARKSFDGSPYRSMTALVSSVGWAWDCCSVQINSSTFNAGVRNETRYIFAFTLKGIGTFGTQNIGQRRP
jgi:LPS-assembly protein